MRYSWVILLLALGLCLSTADTITNVDGGEDVEYVVETSDDDPLYDDYETIYGEGSPESPEEDLEDQEDDESEIDLADPEDDLESNLYDEEDLEDDNEDDIEDLKKDLQKTNGETEEDDELQAENDAKDAYMGYDDDSSRYSHVEALEEEILELERELKEQDEYFEQMDDDEVDIVVMDDSRQEVLETMVNTAFTIEINDKVGYGGKTWQIYKMPQDGSLELLNPEATYQYMHELFPSKYETNDRHARYRFKFRSHATGLCEVIIVYGLKEDLDLYRERHRGTMKDGRISRQYPKKELMIRIVDYMDYEGDGLAAEDIAYHHDELMSREDLQLFIDFVTPLYFSPELL